MNINDIFKGLLFLEGSANRDRGFDHDSEFGHSYGNGAANDRAFGSRYGHHHAAPVQQPVPCCAGGCG
jgi:hypothetical protein